MAERTGRRPKDETGVVEIDATFGLIELHASFLESNLLFQVRALPNPSFVSPGSTQTQQAHPLTVHLSPTSTANVVISSLTPPQPSSTPFAKVSPDGEIIVAPKTRPRLAGRDRTNSRSVASTGRRSAGTRSGAARQRSQRGDTGPSVVFLRGVDKSLCSDFFDEDESSRAVVSSLNVWVDEEILANKPLQGLSYVSVSVVKPAALEPPMDPQQQQRLKDSEESDAGTPSTRIVAKLLPWDYSPDSRHAALSPALCCALGVKDMVGGLVRIEAAPSKLKGGDLESFKFYPFVSAKGESEGLRFGGHPKADKEGTMSRFLEIYRDRENFESSVLDGPLTDGLILPQIEAGSDSQNFEGGILHLRQRPDDGREPSKGPAKWCIGSEVRAKFDIQEPVPNPSNISKPSNFSPDPLPPEAPTMIGIDKLIDETIRHLSHTSSVLLTGGLGAGKSSLALLLGLRLRSRLLYHTAFFPCRKLMTDESRISTVRDTLSRLFMAATWGAKLGGRSLLILDDLDKLCPIETELQTSDNGRSRQISELLCSMVKQYGGYNSGIVILATAQAKEAVNNIIIGGHVFREIVPLKVPDKQGRRSILQALAGRPRSTSKPVDGMKGHSRNTSEGSQGSETAWMAGSPPSHHSDATKGLMVDRDLDFLDLAGQTDGYMPGDLILLISRAKNEALIRCIGSTPSPTANTPFTLTTRDFQSALSGFTPASLRNVPLQSSRTTFSSIGGLHATRKTLLETLHYPTKYAPIFAQCPLRLRSGLLLYGYPGCGKTLLASAVAGECGLNFISVKGPEILNKYIGASEKAVRDLFERAEAARPCVLFFDEFDSIAPKRGHDSTGVTDRVVNQLLTQMDGAEGLSGVYVLAATSRPDLIDPALLRPGRLDKSLLCGMPSQDDRLDILQALSKKLSFAPAIIEGDDHQRSLDVVASRTAGYSGADLQAVVYNAHLEAIHDVLGDHDDSTKLNGKKQKDTSNSTQSSKYDILQFRFGTDSNPETTPSSINRVKEAADYAAIAAKLDALKLAKKKERHARPHPYDSSDSERKSDDPAKNAKQEVTIEWKHIEASLATTRSSISSEERRRLERIYREFVVGRSGEMGSGEGSTEVGGRVSLM
ncbi:Peroxisome biosynthesis protein pex1 [Lecanora helva]